MEFNFIDNSAPNESERAETNRMFVDFVKDIVSDASVEDFETENDISKTKSLEFKKDDLRIMIKERFFKTKREPLFEDTDYEIDLSISHFSDSGTTIHSETYRYSMDNPSVKFVERMTGHMSTDGTNSKHTTETHEVSKEEMTKMLDFVRQKLEND